MIRRALRTPRPKPMAIVTQPARLAALPTISSAACFGTRAVPVVAQASTSQLRIAAPRRTYAAKTMKFKQATISEDEYHDLADNCLNALTDSLEVLVESYDGPDADNYEAEYSSGVLNLRLGSHGTYVINKQPPNKQIWLSSPRSGPKRFDYDEQHRAWFMHKEGEESNMRDLLNTELSDIFGRPIEVDLGG